MNVLRERRWDQLMKTEIRHCQEFIVRLFSLGAVLCGWLCCQSSVGQEPTDFLAQLAAANSALRLNEATEARRWLDEIPQSARGWEWNLLNARSDSSSNTLPTTGWSPIRLDLTSDGNHLAVAGSDGIVRIYEAHTLELENEWKVSEQVLYAARFHPSKEQLAVCARDGQLSVWDSRTGKQLWTQASGGQGLADLAYDPNGQQLLFCSWYRGPETVMGIVSTWDSESGEQTWKTDFGVKPIVAARYSPDGKRFAVGTWDALVGVWSTENRSDPQILDFSDRAQYSAIDDLAFSPDSSRVAAATKNGSPRVWTLDGTAPPIDLVGHSNAVFCISFADDGKTLLSGGSDGVLTAWSIEQRIPIHRFYGHQNKIVSVAVDTKTRVATTTSADKTIRQWDLGQAQSYTAPEAGQFCYGLVLAEQGKTIVTGGQSPETVTVWDAHSKVALRHFPGTEGTINFLDGDGRNWLAGGNWKGDVAIWDIQTGRLVRQMGKPELGGLHQCSLSDDQRWLAVSTNKSQVVIWDAQSGEVGSIIAMSAGCWGLDFSSDSRFLAIGDGQGTVHWLAADSWEPLWTCSASKSQINALRISPKSDWLAAGSDDGTLTVINVGERKFIHQIPAHSERIWTLDISTNGDRIVTGSADRKVKTWDPDSGLSLLTLSDFSEAIYNLRFSADGQDLYVNSLGSAIHRLSAGPKGAMK